MFNGTNLSLNSGVDKDTYMFVSHERSPRTLNKDKDSTVHTIEYRGKGNATFKPQWEHKKINMLATICNCCYFSYA